MQTMNHLLPLLFLQKPLSFGFHICYSKLAPETTQFTVKENNQQKACAKMSNLFLKNAEVSMLAKLNRKKMKLDSNPWGSFFGILRYKIFLQVFLEK